MISIFALGLSGVLRFLVTLFIMVLVIVMCYFTTRFIAKYQKRVTGNGNIEIVEVKAIAPNKTIDIIRIGEQYYAISVTKDNVCLIDTLDRESLSLEEKPEQDMTTGNLGESFGQILEKIKDVRKK